MSTSGNLEFTITPSTDTTKLLDNNLMRTDSLWTVEDVAHLIRVKPGTVRAMAKRGDLPAFKVGKMWRFNPTAVRQWLKEKGLFE
jgi:excisionase family DNA binding protein